MYTLSRQLCIVLFPRRKSMQACAALIWKRLNILFVNLQDDVVLENFPIPEKYFTCPIEDLFDLLGKTFADFASRMKRCCFLQYLLSCLAVSFIELCAHPSSCSAALLFPFMAACFVKTLFY